MLMLLITLNWSTVCVYMYIIYTLVFIIGNKDTVLCIGGFKNNVID